MTYEERVGDIIREAGCIVYFHKMVEHHKQRLEEPVDTPDEILHLLWCAEVDSTTLRMHRAEYERLRKAFSPEDSLVKALDNLIKESGAGNEAH